jgi:hypothetical protein
MQLSPDPAAPRSLLAAISALILSTAAGCGSSLYPVDGKLIWKDGTPATELAGSHVVFEQPDSNVSARGIVQFDASFKLTTDAPDDGVPAGEYQVLVIEVARKSLGSAESGAIAPGVMDARFSDPSTSELTAQVEPGPNNVILSVERHSRR